MAQSIASFVLRVFAAPIEYFNTIVTATSTIGYIVSAFVLVSLVRFIFLPFLGQSVIGSDRVRPERHEPRRYSRRDKYYNPFPTRNDKSFQRNWRD